ncbi:MAG: hypothetical protein OEZ15_10285 [Gammaproteobacteria bacterium]|nr:hypothetical protein [Gammaproteobacteria bacterium]
MNAFTSNASLVLHASDPDWIPDNLEALIHFLQQTELAGKCFNKNDHRFFVGEKFLDHISFMGCSPNIKLEDQGGDGKFTFIRVSTSKTVSALTSKHSFAPHCPQCKKPEKNWREFLKDNQIKCSGCQQTADAWQYNWRKSAGFGRCFIEVTDIYPKEAVPQPSLLGSLEKEFNVQWAYFFYHA